MEKLMESLTDVEDFPGRLLHQAALWDNAELLEDLLNGEELAYINSKDSWGRTALHAASMTEGSRCLRILSQSGAYIDDTCGPRGDGRTALHIAAEHGHLQNIKILIDAEANLTLRDSLGLTPYDLADKASHEECIKLLQAAAADQEMARSSKFRQLQSMCAAGDIETVRSLLDTSLINMTLGGSDNTLLYHAAENGHLELVQYLLDSGADSRANSITRYTPLFIAAYNGYQPIVKLLLTHFPSSLGQALSVESWSPLHAACIHGHSETLHYFLFEAGLLPKITFEMLVSDKTWYYDSPFDINLVDVNRRSMLYLSVCVGSLDCVELLLAYRVKTRPTLKSSPTTVACPTDNKSSGGIKAIISRLHSRVTNNKCDADLEHRYTEQLLGPDESWMSPLDIDMYCNGCQENALHLAVKKRENAICGSLLKAGANPNLSITQVETVGNSTCLREACLNRDLTMIEMLIKYSARDDDCLALDVAIRAMDDIIITKILSLQANQDSENVVNKEGILLIIPRYSLPTSSLGGAISSLAVFPSRFASLSILPTTAVAINWHHRGQCFHYLNDSWLAAASMRLNPKLKLSNISHQIALHAITRLDLSDNILTAVPSSIFTMQSLKYLSISQNKLEWLPKIQVKPVSRLAKRRSLFWEDDTKISAETIYESDLCPWLEELHLQDNRLEALPDYIFNLRSLIVLNVSNNKLQSLPWAIWMAVSLRDMNASFNLLDHLPTMSLLRSPSLTTHFEALSRPSIDDSKSKEISFRIDRLNLWSSSLDVRENPANHDDNGQRRIECLNLSHNLFTEPPRCLSCLAPHLTRLNMSHNNLTTWGPVNWFPLCLKHLDLSYNRIKSWVYIDNILQNQIQHCYFQNVQKEDSPNVSTLGLAVGNTGVTTAGEVLSTNNSFCSHKSHSRLDNLRTLIIADNIIEGLYLHGPDTQGSPQVLYPALSMLDLSNNKLKNISGARLHLLSNLSVLNLSGNVNLTDLPPEIGLLSKLWNFGTKGCSLQGPLASMLNSSKGFKTSEIMSYLRSILENSRPYTRLKLMVVGVQGIGKTTLIDSLRSESGSFKKWANSDHWSKRVGSNMTGSSSKIGGTAPMSTVGVDIGEWSMDRRPTKSGENHGPLMFRTWDFGGQTEYYVTHQYFLSRRSIYLVVWKIIDGEKAVDEILQWLINIQCRAPNSTVIIVGTHSDAIKNEFPVGFSEFLQKKIRKLYLNVSDPEKCGLPKVVDSIEVSCKTRHNLRLLVNVLYDTAFSLKAPGSSSQQRLLHQKIPATYLALEDVVGIMACDLRQRSLDPIVDRDNFERFISLEFKNRFAGLRFRDSAELNMAIKFLHENGILLHYEDSALRDLYFLDPQWLCDTLAHVITIREINPFAKHGLMRIEDLNLVFRSSRQNSTSYIINLLNKFELALTWDTRTLLIPSLLPTESLMRSGLFPGMDIRVRIPVRSRAWGMRQLIRTHRHTATRVRSPRSHSVPGRLLSSPRNQTDYVMSHRSDPEHSLQRLFLMSYFPSGFWSRLITRILADDRVVEIVRSYFVIPDSVQNDVDLSKVFVEHKPEWICWQTGLELKYLDTTLLCMKQVIRSKMINSPQALDYHCIKLMLWQEESWVSLDNQTMGGMLEISLPQDSVVLKCSLGPGENAGYHALVIEPSMKCVTQLLTLAVDHVDTLLEDWYPSLGTRFLHTSEGKMLVTRLIPCPRCLNAEKLKRAQNNSTSSSSSYYQVDIESLINEEQGARISQDSNVSRDSGMYPDCPSTRASAFPLNSVAYSFLVEECIFWTLEAQNATCPVHGEICIASIAPDVTFFDIDERLRICQRSINRGTLIGRGAFGFVFQAFVNQRGSRQLRAVAVKMLQPVDPGSDGQPADVAVYAAGRAKWHHDPLQFACKAYTTARQELSVLMHLKHQNIVPLVGICTNPLSLVLELAPLGSLDTNLKHYRRSGARLGPKVVQMVILQIARALEYLHQQRIIYRDLKSENVLVWKFPLPFEDKEAVKCDVQTKLADYGISRSTLPSGAKGFGGTEGFMAPEIVRYNGEEEYSEKVDCFSFGMFIYELLSLRQPFAGYDTVKELMLDGSRPSLTPADLAVVPSNILDLMVVCWSHSPNNRPSSSQIVSIVTAPDFIHLIDAVSISCLWKQLEINLLSVLSPNLEFSLNHIWITTCTSNNMENCTQLDMLNITSHGQNLTGMSSMTYGFKINCICFVEKLFWLGDNQGYVHAYQVSEPSDPKVFSYQLDRDSSISTMYYSRELDRVAVAMGGGGGGRMFLCHSNLIPHSSEGAEGTFVISELGCVTSISCMVDVIISTNHKRLELWCGQSQIGTVSVFSLKGGVVTAQNTLHHHEISNDPPSSIDVHILVSDFNTFVWSSVLPGTVVYQWYVESNTICHKLDAAKLPCCESVPDNTYIRHSISALAFHGDKLFIGTKSGTLIITEAESMRPISVFRPYDSSLDAILSISLSDNLVVTVGRQYRPLIHRFFKQTGKTFHDEKKISNQDHELVVLLWKSDHFWQLD